ncbi:MAG: hypothetical protein ACRDAO_08200, partial [Culicoidibacterales bacterium]
TVGDTRMYNWDGNTYTQTCTVASPTKGNGTWKTISAPTPTAIFNKSVTTGSLATLTSGSTLNLFTLLNSADGVYTNSTSANWGLSGGVLKFPSREDRINYTIRISLAGTFSGTANTQRTITMTFDRADGTLVVGGNNSVVTSDTLTRTTQLVIPTYTDGVNDTFTTVGTKANVLHNTNQTLTITGIQIAIFGNKM